MYKNIIAQPVTGQLKKDILSGKLAPSMLFFGPLASGKGSTAIETARILSCEEKKAEWNCSCGACSRHRLLVHPDLAMIGPRAFAAEIAASRKALSYEPSSEAARMFFVRSIRKLLSRFSPAVWEYESKSGRANPLALLQTIEEDLNSLEFEKDDKQEKLIDSLVKNSIKLEDEALSEIIPIGQIRMVSYWSRLTPTGKKKTLIIENANQMKDEGRNSLLKLLEEPPSTINIILCCQRKEVILPTILSRIRQYRFIARSADEEQDIIRRVFKKPQAEQAEKDTEKSSSALIASYLGSFLPQPPDKMLPLAAFFAAAAARSAAVSASKQGQIPAGPKALGEFCAPIAEVAGLERTVNAKETIAELVSRSNNFEGRSFSLFLQMTLNLVSWSFKNHDSDPNFIDCCTLWSKRLNEAHTAFSVWNQKPELILESLFYRVREDMSQ